MRFTKWKHSKIHVTLFWVWVLITILAFVLGWAGKVWFVTIISLYTIGLDHLVGYEASRAKEETTTRGENA